MTEKADLPALILNVNKITTGSKHGIRIDRNQKVKA